MKYTFLLITLMGSMLMGQFEQGTISAGSLFSYSSTKYDKDDDTPTGIMTIGSEYTWNMTIKPAVSYFLMDNLSLDAIVSMNTQSHDGNKYSMNLFGPGATYYMNSMYAGGGFVMSSSKSSDDDDDYESTEKSNFLELHGGYLHGITDNIFLDIGASYLMGTGKVTDEYTYDGETDKEEWDNEQTMFRIGVGIKVFFSL